jgi:hypothetical protein
MIYDRVNTMLVAIRTRQTNWKQEHILSRRDFGSWSVMPILVVVLSPVGGPIENVSRRNRQSKKMMM